MKYIITLTWSNVSVAKCQDNDPSHVSCIPPRKKIQPADRHGWAHKTFFAQTRVWRIPNNNEKHIDFQRHSSRHICETMT